ncbi:MAG: MCE family protein [Actinomycetota bacterium]|nr:MCE family protein [Actinomycetota bacterium]
MSGRRPRIALSVAAAVAVAAVAVTVTRPAHSYQLRAVFASADGLFPGNTVEILGVPSGAVSAVTNENGAVDVTMVIDGSRRVPTGARAALVSPNLLGEPSIDVSPGYTGGPSLAPGATIPESRTSVPISTDRLLRDLQAFLSKIDPTATGNLVTRLATDLAGQGPGINALLGNAAGTVSLLAQKGDDLGRLETALADITATLRSRTSTITDLIRNYDTVSAVVAAHQGQLGTALTDLADATTRVSQFLSPNLGAIESDVAGVTRVGRTLDRNLSSLDQVLSSAVLLFTAAQRAYDPTHNWLNLNNQAAPGVTTAVVTGMLRDRLAGICRRLLAHHAAGLDGTQRATLATCGNPSSGFFDPILGLFPPIVTALTSGPGGGPDPVALQALLAKGLAMIPGASALAVPTASGPAPSAAPSGPSPGGTPAAAPSLEAPAASQLPPVPASPSPAGSGSSGGGLGGMLGGLLGSL